MSSETERERVKSSIIFREQRALLLVLVMIVAFFASAETASAYTGPYKLIIFTDKKVYLDDPRTTANAYTTYSARNVVFNTYAVVLDQDGNIVRSGISLQGKYRDVANYTHPGGPTHHTATRRTGYFYNNISLGAFTQIGTSGIFVSTTDPTDFSILPNKPPNPSDHIEILINVTATGPATLAANTTVLFSLSFCYHASGKTPFSGIEHTKGNHDGVPCTICHWGMEHQLGVHGDDGPLGQEISGVDRKIGTTSGDPRYNTGYYSGPGTSNSTALYSEFKSATCLMCHGPSSGVSGASILDMGYGGESLTTDVNGDGITGDNRPSCSWYQGANSTVPYPVCHASTSVSFPYGATNISQTSLQGIDWNWKQTGAGNSTSHNHTGNKANVSCEICHGNHNITGLPNNTATGSDYPDINNQCVLCHNITGGLNITINGGKNVNHTIPDCKACHQDFSVKVLDTHTVGVAGIPNANCTECHDLGGKAPYHIDFNIFNKSDYVHNQYNVSAGMSPLNFNASNGSAVRPSENKICWACHGNDLNNDGRADFSEQPTDNHPAKYKAPRICEDCHQNPTSPWGAPQNVAHSYNTSEVRTPGAPHCYDCHGQPVMYNNSHSDPDYNRSLKATLAYHYGTGFPALEESRGKNGYCIKYCHQNSTSPFKAEFFSEKNMERPNHSAMTSRLPNQSCRNEQCHAADKIHDEKMKKPTLSGGTFGNSNCTAIGCHSISDSPFINYSWHNGVVNCTSCHMDNKGENIHPIKYLQINGWDFAQVNTTAANCKLCHKNSQADNVTKKWGVTPKKIGSQHHSEDPKNGSKWNRTTDPYWDYAPHEITFVNGWINNSNRGFLANFEAMGDTNASAARISENTTIDAYFGIHPSNHEFNSTEQSNGWSANGTATVKAWSNLPEDGNPAGSIVIASTTKSQAVDVNWTTSFVYNKTGQVARGTIKMDSKLVKAANMNKGVLKAVNVTIDDNSGNITEVYNRSLPNTAEPDWIESGDVDIPNPESVFWKNGSLDHSYNLTIRTRWTGLGGNLVPNIKVAIDNVFVNISEVDYKKYNFIFYINNTPHSDNLYNLIIGYQTHSEPARLYVLKGSIFEFKTDLDSGAFTKVTLPLSKEEYNNGNITLRINDSNGLNETLQDVDVRADYIDLEYLFVESYQWVNNKRLTYPCEYCHAPNKHFQHALGIPYEFKGNNHVGQEINDTTSWCASCHYQGYSSGNKNYNDMVQAFLNHLLPVPPEITGHSQYGVNKSIDPDYYEHSSLGNFNDSKCFECHRGGLAGANTTSTVFMHNVSTGTAGGRNCTSCHDLNGAQKKVNFASVAGGMHGALNKNATGNATNKPCWGCHGTKNGTWANETDQPLESHSDIYSKPRKCHDCHNATSPLFGAKPVTDHVPAGIFTGTDVSTSRYNRTYCAYCHNNSIGTSSDPDGMGITSAMNASSAHYGANRTKGMLMSVVSNSTDCVYCHRNSSNMVKWGILQGSRANISNKNSTGGGTNHDPYTSSNQCSTCHGGYVVIAGFTFHNSTLGPGAGGGPDCTGCHNVSTSGSYAKVDFAAINLAIHGGLNRQANSSPENITNKPCWGCHGTRNGTYANESDQPVNDHNNTYKSSPRKCEDCHINGSVQFNAPGLTEHIMPGRNSSTEINVTEGYCSVCHNNSVSSNNDYDGMGIFSAINASAAHYAKDANLNLMTTISHSDNCTYCHFTNNGSSAWLTPRKPLTSTHSSYSNSTLPPVCWGCHADSRSEPSTFHAQEINRGTGSGPNCRGCHNISNPDTGRGHIDADVFNTSIHGNMNTTNGADLNEPCWGCHGNGEMEGHNNTGDAYGKGAYKNPYNCTDCHTPAGIRYAWAQARGALTVAEHYTGGTEIKASYNATTIYSCLKCHQDIGELRLSNSDNDTNRTAWTSGGDTYNANIGGNNSPYHYGKKRIDLRSGTNTICTYCHQNLTTAFASIMQNPSGNKSILEHTDNGTNITGSGCIDAGCHASGYIHNSTLTKPQVLVWTPGSKDYCAPCHKPDNISATRYVYNQRHDPANSIGDRIGDCGYCHNASSQGINGSTVKLHTPTLTNATSPLIFSSCQGCHNGTSLYVGAAKQLLSHLPDASAYRGNTSMSNYTCSSCHNLSGKPSMHSAGMNRSNGTCITCHFNRTSPFKATKKIIGAGDYNHTYSGQKTCNITQCHNASGAALGFHIDMYAAGVVADPERLNPVWSDKNNSGNGFTDTPHVDCVDCHRQHNNTYPFNNSPNFEANLTGENKKIHTSADSIDACYNCHTNRTDAKDRYMVHNVTVEPLLGGPACVKCHNLSAPVGTGLPPASRRVNHTALNQSAHRKLINYTAWNESKKPNSVLLDSACWTCHATNITEIPNNAHPDRGGPASTRPFQCKECHPESGNVSNYNPEIYQNATRIYQHYSGKIFVGSIVFNSTKECPECHKNSLVSNTTVSYSSYAYGNEANASHYATRQGLIATNSTGYGCNRCHAVGGSGGYWGVDYGNAISVPVEHNLMGSSGMACQKNCHNINPGMNIRLHDQEMGVYIGMNTCYGTDCHQAPPEPDDGGGRR